MLVTSTITEKKEVTKEVKLPYCAKSNNSFFRINPDESILYIIKHEDWVNIDFSKKNSVGYRTTLNKIFESQECDEVEILNALQSATSMVETSIPETV